MNPIITTTFIIILAFSAINAAVSFFIYATAKRELYLRTGLFWSALILNFLLQGHAQTTENEIIWSYSFGAIPSYLLVYASLFFVDVKFPTRALFTLCGAAAVLTAILIWADLPFVVKAMPLAATFAFAELYVVYQYLGPKRKRLTPLMALHAFVLVLLGIHSIDFALFRLNPHPNAQLWGWMIAYGLYQVMALLFPALTLDFLHNEEQERLKGIIDERTKALTAANANLEVANVHLAELFRQKDFLFKTLTHDILNPLTNIHTRAGMPDMVLANPKKFVGDVRNMTDRIASLIRQVRQYDGLEKHLMELKVEDANVLELVHDSEELFHDRLAAKSLRLDYSSGQLSALIVRVEKESFLTSVLPNLINNAIKFSPIGGTIRIEANLSDECHVSLNIIDGGMGIPEALVTKLFEFGQTTSRPGTAGEKGTGYGLPILARIVKAYEGEIRVHTRVQTDLHAGMTRMELVLPGHGAANERSA